MMESKKLAIKEWADRNGLKVTDYDAASKLNSNHNMLIAIAIIVALYLVATIAGVIYYQHTIQSSALSGCVNYFNNLSYKDAYGVCQKVLSGVTVW